MLVIYGLVDPRSNCVRYVGATTRTPQIRVSELVSHAKSRGMAVGDWLAELAGQHLRPGCLVLEADPPDGAAAEARHIANLQKQGAGLLNVALGGPGAPGIRHTEEIRQRLAAANLGRTVGPETRRRISAAQTGRHRPDLAARNRAAAILSPAQVSEIRSRLENHEAGASLAREFGVSSALVSLIRNDKRRSSTSDVSEGTRLLRERREAAASGRISTSAI